MGLQRQWEKFKLTESVTEGEFRENDVEEFVPSNEQLDKIKNKFLPDWEMTDHRYLETMYVCKDHQQAVDMIDAINDISENMDHFAEVTQDVTEVKVRTATYDVKGLTVLDFQLALQVDVWAEQNDVEQVPTSGNFGMHEAEAIDQELEFDNDTGVMSPLTLTEEPVDEADSDDKIYDKCWKGYKKVPGKKRGEAGSCVKK